MQTATGAIQSDSVFKLKKPSPEYQSGKGSGQSQKNKHLHNTTLAGKKKGEIEKMKKEFWEIDDQLSEIEILFKHVFVMLRDLNDYFSERVESPHDCWKIMGYFYEYAGDKAEIAMYFASQAMELLDKLSNYINEEAKKP